MAELGLVIDNRLQKQPLPTMVYSVSVGERAQAKEGLLFLHNRQIDAAIASAGLQKGDAVGQVDLALAMEKGVFYAASFSAFFPIGSPENPRQIKSMKFFSKKGIGSLIEARIYRHLKKTFPTIKHVTFPHASFVRREQLKKRGLKMPFDRKFRLALVRKTLLEKLRADKQKHRQQGQRPKK